jgi:hypothetical protein
VRSDASAAGSRRQPPRDALHHDPVVRGWTLKWSVWERFLACGWFTGRLDMPSLHKDRGVAQARRLSEWDHHALWHLCHETGGGQNIRLEEMHGVAHGYRLVCMDGR